MIWKKFGTLFLPSLIVVLFDLLSLRVDAPTAGGLSFLTAILAAYFFFPKLRVRPRRLAEALVLAVGVAALMSVLL
ncbi:MAG TPA: hypothetical protein VHU19_01385 [Pyrinomonadaceae bacterium]|jgi:UDP-N-acetylmuramyl pentapeptide phosphotransferase/UDP-N-acetylglucosamine-1-phosphate transferase|nr:hypothetical protein [Pyrinomonadaceae bacterium]